ncbi:MAG: hypothetical protein JWO31_3867 [Phycisphaerales bacterium]|nr:hypothetical protein [Phycisphaerales bacterium]
MFSTQDLLTLAGTAVAAVVMVIVLRWRRRDHAGNTQTLADENVCEHLRPALDRVRAAGGRVTRVGQHHPDLPLEIHVEPPFDPQGLYAELKLADPVFVSERNVLYCKEDWCELHPKP